ncbi:MAG: hypothetical protein ACLFPW_05370 [Spirochaetaceae bacterium]
MEKFSIPKLREFLEKTISFVKGHTLHLAAGGAILLLLILGGVLIANLPGSRGESAEERPGGADGPIRTLIPREEAFLPNERQLLLELEEERYRQPLTPWEEELVEEFWNPVRETAIEALMAGSREEIDELFERVE